MKRKYVSKEDLVNLYIVQSLTLIEIQHQLNISRKVLYDYLKEYNIEKTTEQKFKDRSNWTKIYNDNKLKERVKNLYIDQGLSVSEVRKRLKISAGKLFKIVHLLGYQRPEAVKRANMEKTCLERYGVASSFQLKDIQEKAKRTLFEKYGAENYAKSEEYQIRVPEIQEKIYQTQKKQGTLYKRFSKTEEQAYQLLLQYFPKEDITRQYKTKEYPFNCDFYIKSLDLYIECQFSQYHGHRKFHLPFNPKDRTHLEQVQKLKELEEQNSSRQKSQYTRMLKVWTIEDPLKRKTAKENNLNWIEFFSLKDLQEWLA